MNAVKPAVDQINALLRDAVRTHDISFDEFVDWRWSSKCLLNLPASTTVTLRNWLPEGMRVRKVLYRGSEHSFRARAFHKHCDHKGPTLTLIKSTTGHVFGGFTTLSWASAGSYRKDATAFIFSLLNPKATPPQRFSSLNAHSVYDHADYLPTFGSGHDIYLCNGCNLEWSSYTNFPHGYGPDSDSTGHGSGLFTGARSFVALEVEVWLVV